MTLNGEAVADLDVRQMEALFAERSVGLTLLARPPADNGTLSSACSETDLISRAQKSLLPPPNQSQLLEEFLDNLKKNTPHGKAWSSSSRQESVVVSFEAVCFCLQT